MQQSQNKLTEVALLVIVGLLIVAGAFLLYVGKVDFTGMLTLFGFAGGILGVNGAFKAPSPAQSAQLQGLLSQVMNVLPGLLSQLQPPPITIHNNIPASANPPTATVPVSAAAQPAPVQITPNPAFSATTSINPFAQPAPVAQQAFPAPQYPSRFTADVPATRV